MGWVLSFALPPFPRRFARRISLMPTNCDLRHEQQPFTTLQCGSPLWTPCEPCGLNL